MRIIIETVGISVTPSLKTYTEKKIGSLSKLIEKTGAKGEGAAIVEISKTTNRRSKGMVFRAGGSLKFGKTSVRAESNAEDARAAIDFLKDELKRKITSSKEKFISEGRRKERSAKKSLRLSKLARFRDNNKESGWSAAV